MKKISKHLLAQAVCLCLSGISFAQTVNYKIIHDSPWLPKNKPVRFYADVLTVDMINGTAAMCLGLRAEYFYEKYGTIKLERRMGYLDGKSGNDGPEYEALKHYAFTDIGATYNLKIKSKKVPVNVVITSKKTEGNKSIKFENEEYMIDGTKGKVSSLRGGIINFRVPEAYTLYKSSAWHTNSSNAYIGLSRMTSINVWAQSQYGIGGFRNRWGVFADAIYNFSTKQEDFVPVAGKKTLDAKKVIGYRAGFTYDGVSDGRAPNLGFLSTRLEFGMLPGDIKSFYMNLSTGLCFDLGVKKRK